MGTAGTAGIDGSRHTAEAAGQRGLKGCRIVVEIVEPMVEVEWGIDQRKGLEQPRMGRVRTEVPVGCLVPVGWLEPVDEDLD
jgi:hypothetical protein